MIKEPSYLGSDDLVDEEEMKDPSKLVIKKPWKKRKKKIPIKNYE